jgi:hypothetical protein
MDPEDPGFTKRQGRRTGRDFGYAPLGQTAQEKIHYSKSIKTTVNTLRETLPRIMSEIGPMAGNGEMFIQHLGASHNYDAQKFVRKLDFLTVQHSNLAGRQSVQMAKLMKTNYKSIDQFIVRSRVGEQL